LTTNCAFILTNRSRNSFNPDCLSRKRAVARLLIGGSDLIKEECRDARGVNFIEAFLQDLRYAFRMLRKFHGFALATIILLALGMGGVATLFGPLYSLVLSPLPFPHSDRLVRLGGHAQVFSVYTSDFTNRRSLDPVFSAISAFASSQSTISSASPAEELNVAAVTPEFFATFGVPPQLGNDGSRLADSNPGTPVAIVSDHIWHTRLQQAPDLATCSIVLDGQRFTVAGVMPPGFDFPPGTEIWEPRGMALKSSASITLVGRMRAELSMRQAVVRLKTIVSTSSKNGMLYPGGPLLESLHTFVMGDRRPLLWMMWAVSMLFLLLACAGAASLLLARGVRRRPEMAVRLVLGAGRKRLLRQMLTEVLILAMAGGLLGLGFSAVGSRWLQLILPAAQGTTSSTPLFLAIIALLAALAVTVTILCGLAPAFHVTSGDLYTFLKTGNSGIPAAAPRRRIATSHELLAGLQLVLAMALLISTGLLLRSMSARLNLPLGFQPKDVAVIEVKVPRLPATIEAGQNYYLKHNLDPDRVLVGQDAVAAQRALSPWTDAERTRNKLFYNAAVYGLAGLPGADSQAGTVA